MNDNPAVTWPARAGRAGARPRPTLPGMKAFLALCLLLSLLLLLSLRPLLRPLLRLLLRLLLLLL